MGIKEQNIIKNRMKKKEKEEQRVKELQKVLGKNSYSLYESDEIWKEALDKGFC